MCFRHFCSLVSIRGCPSLEPLPRKTPGDPSAHKREMCTSHCPPPRRYLPASASFPTHPARPPYPGAFLFGVPDGPSSGLCSPRLPQVAPWIRRLLLVGSLGQLAVSALPPRTPLAAIGITGTSRRPVPAPALPPVFEGGTWTTRAIMALRIEIERVDGQLACTMPFVALRCSTGGLIAATGDSIDLARFLVAWTQLDRDDALISTFETHGAASSWFSIMPLTLPTWAARICLAMDDEDLINLEDETDPFPVFALLRQVGGQLAHEDNTALTPRLVNTVNALNGEVAVERTLSSMGDAEQWLLKFRVPAWLLAPAAVLPTVDETKGDDAVVVTVTTADGVIHLSDDEEDGQDAEAAARSAFRRAALAPPPPPPITRSILALSSIKNSMLLPVAFQRHSVTGSVFRARRGGPDTADGDSSSATGASLLTPPSPPTSTPSMASRSPGAGTRPALSARPLAQT